MGAADTKKPDPSPPAGKPASEAIPASTPTRPASESPPPRGTPPPTEDFLPASHWTDRPADDDDADSAFDSDDAASSTASITSSILAYRVVNGRSYHAERGTAAYWASNDQLQGEASDLFAHLCTLSLDGKLHKTPLDRRKLAKALDVGTGTGLWAMDFADENPNCEVIGTDVSPIQPSWVPPNCKFEIEDCTQPWTFESDTFDFIHMRLLYGSIADWEGLFDEAYRVLKPGGWIESHEAAPSMDCDDCSVPADKAIAQWGKFFYEFGRHTGRTFRVIHDDIQANNMRRLGMQNVRVWDIKCPIGPWPQDPHLNEIGRVSQAVMQDCEGWLTFVAHETQGWTKEEVSIFCAHIRREIRNPDYHAFVRHRVVIGQKPERDDQDEE